MILEKTFQQEVGRYAAVIPQLLPLAGIWAGLSLKAILLLYSLSFIILYYIIFLIISYILKNDTIALAVPLALVLGVSDSFYWISTETHQTIAYNLLLFAFLYYTKDNTSGFLIDLKNYFITSFFIFLCFFTHPVSLFTVLFILGYFAIDTRSWNIPFVYVMAVLVVALHFSNFLLSRKEVTNPAFLQASCRFLRISDFCAIPSA